MGKLIKSESQLVEEIGTIAALGIWIIRINGEFLHGTEV